MKVVDLSKKFTDLAGEPLQIEGAEGFTYGRALANILLSHRDGKLDVGKLYAIAMKVYPSGATTEFDDADARKILEIILADKTYSPLINGQLLASFQ